jgi:hypothetical protein
MIRATIADRMCSLGDYLLCLVKLVLGASGGLAVLDRWRMLFRHPDEPMRSQIEKLIIAMPFRPFVVELDADSKYEIADPARAFAAGNFLVISPTVRSGVSKSGKIKARIVTCKNGKPVQ